MRLYLLDTNAVSDLVADHPRVRARTDAVEAPDRIAVSTIVFGEVLFGIEKMPHQESGRSWKREQMPSSVRLPLNPFRLQRHSGTRQ
jgi:predicted nucleic acid-binding protein